MERMFTRDQVVDYLNTEVMYKPGWTIVAAPVGDSEVRITVAFEVTNSSRELAREGYPEYAVVTPIPAFTFGMGEPVVNEAGILSALMTFLVDIEIHEAREFLRVKTDDYAAPFHPHRWSGDARFEQLGASWPTTFPRPTDGSTGDILAEMEDGLEADAQESHLAADLLESYREFKARQTAGPVHPELAALLTGQATGGDQGFEDDRYEDHWDEAELSPEARKLAAELGIPLRD